ncbi:hypothetical protein LCGC14_2651860, partial [marine sediment metagenome]
LEILDSWTQGDTKPLRQVAEFGRTETEGVGIISLRALYQMGEGFRSALKNIANPDNTITLLRGEKSFVFSSGQLPKEGVINRPPQALQSYSTHDLGAQLFAPRGKTLRESFIMERDVPIDDIVLAPQGITVEREVLVLDRNKVPDNLYNAITGKNKTEIGRVEGMRVPEIQPRPVEAAQRAAQPEAVETAEAVLHGSARLQKAKLEGELEVLGDIAEEAPSLKSRIAALAGFLAGDKMALGIKGTEDVFGAGRDLREALEAARTEGIKLLPRTQRILDEKGAVLAVGRNLEVPSRFPDEPLASGIDFSIPEGSTNDIIDRAQSAHLSSRPPRGGGTDLPSSGGGIGGGPGRGPSTGPAGFKGGEPPRGPSTGTGKGAKGRPPPSARAAAEEASGGDKSVFDYVNRLFRTLWATLDGSWWGIQGLLQLSHLPARVARGMPKALAAMRNPK